MKPKEELFYEMHRVARSEYEDAISDPAIRHIKNLDSLWDDFDSKVREIARYHGLTVRLLGAMNPQMQNRFEQLRSSFYGAVVSVNLDQFAKPHDLPNVHFFEYANDAVMIQLACSEFGDLFEAQF